MLHLSYHSHYNSSGEIYKIRRQYPSITETRGRPLETGGKFSWL